MRTLLIAAAFAAAAAVPPSHADTLEIYRTTDSQGRVEYTNVKPGHEDYDRLDVEYESQPATRIPPAAIAPAPAPRVRTAAAAPASQAIGVSARVLALPSLRLASTAGEPSSLRRRKPIAPPGMALRIDSRLQGVAFSADD